MPNCTLTLRVEGAAPSAIDLHVRESGRISTSYTWTFDRQVLGPPLGPLTAGAHGSYDNRLPQFNLAQDLWTSLAHPRWSFYLEPRGSYLATTAAQGLIFIIAGLPQRPARHQRGTGLYFPLHPPVEEGVPITWMVREA